MLTTAFTNKSHAANLLSRTNRKRVRYYFLPRVHYKAHHGWTGEKFSKWRLSSLGQTLSTFHYTLLHKCRALLSVVERGWANALDFSLDLELNIPRMYYLMNESFMECFVHYLMNSNCACVRSTTLDNFALDQTSLDKLQSSRLHSTRWPNALDISLNMHVERCIVKSRERLARASYGWKTLF